MQTIVGGHGNGIKTPDRIEMTCHHLRRRPARQLRHHRLNSGTPFPQVHIISDGANRLRTGINLKDAVAMNGVLLASQPEAVYSLIPASFSADRR